ncbi:peptide deformylase [Galdieria sulphuraria]|uniref:Peptide deformylase n=1 Tax=Galdieria sulphuraria TaxID=130081 RepID=M2Y975_GALSU|nr:peptide deformylase [Galdieria sulphuraria]EME32648.1 peptide deformylase [Galdieria sulphuraria]|eukprot:XP_005709168.1 peptide deformylase [Galdieria sulphuraria]
MVFLSQVTGPSWYARNPTGLNGLRANNCVMSNGSFLGKPVFYGRMKKMWVPPGLRPKRPSFQQLGREVSLLEVDGEDYLPCDVNMSGLYELPKTLEVVKYPDPRLRKENEEVDPCHPSVGEIARKMFQVMYADRGVGLAAPQVGINQRLMVYNPTGKPSSFLSQVVMVNPKIVDCSDKKVVDLEGCLSFPGIAGKVSRHEWVRVEAFKPGGKKIKLKLEGWQARIFQHEYDHLDGILFIDRMEPEERARAQFVLDQLVNNYKGNGIPQL